MSVISVNYLTKDYGHGRGVFGVSIAVEKGECYGFLGPNGAGKTTTIRHLMGFSKPQNGSARIKDKNTWEFSAELKNTVGYLPGEIAFPDSLTGKNFLKMMADMRGLKGLGRTEELCEYFELDGSIVIKRMSLGTKRKLAVCAAFMHDPDILILDEPTSGLDPVMQQKFITFIIAEKKKGKTIFLSSHIFHEVDAACDRIAIIKDGRIVSEFKADELKRNSAKVYRVAFKSTDDMERFTALPYQVTEKNEKEMKAGISVSSDMLNNFIADISLYDIADIYEMPFTLENYFMQFYRSGKEFEEVR